VDDDELSLPDVDGDSSEGSDSFKSEEVSFVNILA